MPHPVRFSFLVFQTLYPVHSCNFEKNLWPEHIFKRILSNPSADFEERSVDFKEYDPLIVFKRPCTYRDPRKLFNLSGLRTAHKVRAAPTFP